MALRTFLLVVEFTLWGLLLTTLETVAIETLAFRATSNMVDIESVRLETVNLFHKNTLFLTACQVTFPPLFSPLLTLPNAEITPLGRRGRGEISWSI
jgi:hypothetical protein